MVPRCEQPKAQVHFLHQRRPAMPFNESADMGPNRRHMDRGGESNLICISEYRRMLRWICERYAHSAPYAIICIQVATRFQSLGLTPWIIASGPPAFFHPSPSAPAQRDQIDGGPYRDHGHDSFIIAWGLFFLSGTPPWWSRSSLIHSSCLRTFGRHSGRCAVLSDILRD